MRIFNFHIIRHSDYFLIFASGYILGAMVIPVIRLILQ
jgi:hypothetical protein